jgi:uncharacterized membrane protein
LIGWLIGQYFMAGFTRAALKATRSEQASFGDFFSAGSRYIPYLGSELVKLLGIGLLAAVLVGPGLLLSFEVSRFAGSIAALIGGLVFLIVGIIVSLGLKNAPYYVMDQNLGPIAALRASWDSSRGQKVDLLVLSLAQLGISLLGLAACCLGLFVAVPIVLISQAIVYMKMSGTAPLAAHGREPAYSPGAYGGYGAYGPPGGAGGQGPPGYGP